MRNYRNTSTPVPQPTTPEKPTNTWEERLVICEDFPIYPFEYSRINSESKHTATKWKSTPKLIIMKKGSQASLSIVKDGYTKSVISCKRLQEIIDALQEFIKTDEYKALVEIETLSNNAESRISKVEAENAELKAQLEALRKGKKTTPTTKSINDII